MSEENTSSVRRNKKVAGVEDPIVIIQRLLNIFRQRHILDDKQKADFDNLILQQPPEIRHMCNILPGGSLLQEYIDELEEKNGLTPNQILDEPLGNTILTNALAANNKSQSSALDNAAKNNASDNSQTAQTNIQTLELQKQMLMMMQKMQNQTLSASVPQGNAAQATIKADASFAKEMASALAEVLAQKNEKNSDISSESGSLNAASAATIKVDPSFAKEMASIMSDALSASDEKRRKEVFALAQAMIKSQQESTSSLIKELRSQNVPSPVISSGAEGNVKIIDNTKEITKAITESQLEMAKMFLQQNAINANNNANNANNIQINNLPAANSKDLIGDIIKAQSQLFREMAREQTKEISSIISGALKESSQLSNQYLVKALKEFQQENLNLLKQHASQQTIFYQPLPNVSGSDVLPQNSEKTSENVAEAVVDNQEKSASGFKRVFNNMFNFNKQEEPQKSEEKFEDIVNNSQNSYEETNAEEEFENISPIPETRELQSEPDFVSENIDNDTVAKKKKKKKKKQKKNDETALQPLTPADLELRDLLGYDSENIDHSDDDNAISVSDNTLESFDNKNTYEDSNSISDFPADILSEDTETDSSENLSSFEQENSLKDENFIEDTIPETSFFNDSVPEPEAFSQQPVSESPSEDIVQAKEENSLDYLIDNEHTSDVFTPEDLPSFVAEPMSDDKETEYEEEPAEHADEDTAAPIEAQPNTNESDGDWEWEYEEEPAEQADEDTAAPVEAQPNTNESDGNWEWEYEEEPAEQVDEDTVAPVEAQSDTNESDGDWEWEYEEEPAEQADEDTVAPVEAQPDTNESDGDWEWEYEEEPAEQVDEDTVAPVEAQSDVGDSDGDWEWEYEEEPAEQADEDTAAPVEAQPDTNESDGDWEWEYEEEPAEQVDEDTAAPVEAQSDAGDSDGDWEWEYEEEPAEQVDEDTADKLTKILPLPLKLNRMSAIVTAIGNGNTKKSPPSKLTKISNKMFLLILKKSVL